MGIEENKEVVREFFKRFSQGDNSAFDELATENFVFHALSGPGDGVDIDKDRLKGTNAMGHVAFPDYSLEVVDMIAEGDKVMTIAKRTGTNTGELLGLPPTEKTISMFRMALFRVENGRVAEMWGMDDWLSQFQQLGILGPNEDIIGAYKKTHNIE